MTESDYLIDYGKPEIEKREECDFEEAFKEYFSYEKISPYFKGILMHYGMNSDEINNALKQYEESFF